MAMRYGVRGCVRSKKDVPSSSTSLLFYHDDYDYYNHDCYHDDYDYDYDDYDDSDDSDDYGYTTTSLLIIFMLSFRSIGV